MTKLGTIDLSSTSAEKCFFGDLALNFRHTSKKIKGGSPKKILEKKNVFPKSMSNLGRLTVNFEKLMNISKGEIFSVRKSSIVHVHKTTKKIFFPQNLFLPRRSMPAKVIGMDRST